MDIRQNATRPVIVSQLLDQDGSPLPLAGATVTIAILNHLGILLINEAVIITDAGNAIVEYEFDLSPALTPGRYYIFYKIIYSDGGIDSVPRGSEYLELNVHPDFGAS